MKKMNSLKILRNTFLFLLLISQIKLNAQNEYDLARIALTVTPKKTFLSISRTDKQFETIDVEIKKEKNLGIPSDHTPVLLYINNMLKDGWEIFLIDGGTYFLRKKMK